MLQLFSLQGRFRQCDFYNICYIIGSANTAQQNTAKNTIQSKYHSNASCCNCFLFKEDSDNVISIIFVTSLAAQTQHNTTQHRKEHHTIKIQQQCLMLQLFSLQGRFRQCDFYNICYIIGSANTAQHNTAQQRTSYNQNTTAMPHVAIVFSSRKIQTM
jgi:hypothetical protein